MMKCTHTEIMLNYFAIAIIKEAITNGSNWRFKDA